MSDLLVRRTAPVADGTCVTVTPDSAGWEYVGFEVLELEGCACAARDTGTRELCVVVVSGTVDVLSAHGEWRDLGSRADPWSGLPDAAYLPPGTAVEIEAVHPAEVALCWAPARNGGASARVLPGHEIELETRGHGAQERTIAPILMGDREAGALLVSETLTPGGHWSSYPPHKHDTDDLPSEARLEETYYHRLKPAHGFGLQRVYTADGSLDLTMAFADRDCVLVPRGYHTVSAPPGYDLYYLNVMAGPVRDWAVTTDPEHEWTLIPR